MVYAGILAGGYGWNQRKEDMPRQYMELGTKPIMLHSLEQFIVHAAVDKIVIAAPGNWLVYTEDLVSKYIRTEKEIHIIEGGSNKYQTIIRIAKFINERWGIQENDICIYHDAIRPFVTQRIIGDNLEKITRCQAVSTVVPTVDTVIRLEEGNKVVEIPPKRELYAEQTPQTFRLKTLLKAHDSLEDEQEKAMVNAFRAFLQRGYEIQVVEGEPSNIKIVTQYDFEVANLLIRDKAHD
ncbi:MAG: 2-C-methyl-D-erythritol 4-phosphate cytidylyltransferase [Lachnospiraceae bacterium]|nr:2-C-methyl-D-erythritol 4-phosphate cytidylyltransferase [Lachnospiraceae bacterium]